MIGTKIIVGIIAITAYLFPSGLNGYAANGLTLADLQTEVDRIRLDQPNALNTNLVGPSETPPREIDSTGEVPAANQEISKLMCSQAASSYLECISADHWIIGRPK